MSDAKPDDGRSRRPSEPYLKDELLDSMARMNFALLSELWILRDRFAVLERIMIDKGVLGAEEIDSYQPDAALDRYLNAQRDMMVETVVGAPYNHEKTVEQLRVAATLRAVPIA